MKNIEFCPSGWRSFLGRSFVGAAAMLAFTSVYAVNIENFADAFAKVSVTNVGDTTCVHTLDSANGSDDMVGLERDVCISLAASDGFGVASVDAQVASNALTITAGGGSTATAFVVWDSHGGDNGTVNTSGINPAANMVIHGESTLVVRIRADMAGGGVKITFYSGAASSTYNFAITQAQVNQLVTLEKFLNNPNSTAGGGANLASVTAIRLDVEPFQQSMDIAFDLLATPVEVVGFDCNCSGGMVNYEWATTWEEDIASFLVGTCSEAGCRLLGEIAPQGTGFSYKASLVAAGDGDCAMAVLDTNGQFETDNGQVVLYTGSCD
ncbi:hypothetical protein PN36_03540 [Candidatus Thiomargarita nelsonii]|uniref:Uncharacterized protein n=1 Tax=Candidatus Thiomargarita nelsonii TaxID=1003181 RepID=A0A0A6PEJ5_9GAMM|nr:hypothetical protein PN36_03540 [Candidatus Thiomargarita nelsonii]